MSKFKVGDVVIRTRDSGWCGRTGKIGFTGTVTAVYPDGHMQINGSGGQFNPIYFELHSRPTPQREGPKLVECINDINWGTHKLKFLTKGKLYAVESSHGPVYKLVGTKGLWSKDRFRVVISKKKEETQMSQTNSVRKFWMVASATAGVRFDHQKYRQHGGAPYRKYYNKQEALNAITDMTRSYGHSYYLLESVEHHAPVAQTPTVRTTL